MKYAVAAALVLALAACAPKPEDALKDALLAAEQGHCDGFEQRFSAGTRAMMGRKLDSACTAEAAKMARLPEGGRVDDVEITGRTVNGDVATVTAVLHQRDGTVGKPMTIRMVKEDGKWRLEPSK